jgi:hypothetical protein
MSQIQLLLSGYPSVRKPVKYLDHPAFYVVVLPVFFAIATAFRYFQPAYYPTVDSGFYFQTFAYALSEYRTTGQFPLWVPDASYGTTSDFFMLTAIGPSQYLLLFVGRYLHASALTLFLSSIVIDQFIFLVGVALIALRLFKNTRLVLFYCIAASALAVTFDNQFGLNFKAFQPMPLILFFIIAGFSELKFYMLVLGALTAVVFIYGTLAYVLPFQFCCAVVFAVPLLVGPNFRQRLRALAVSAIEAKTAIAVLGGTALLIILHLITTRISTELVTYHGRGEDFRPSLETFLNHGGYTGIGKLREIFDAQPINFRAEFTSYFGIVGIMLVFLAVFVERSRQFYAFLAVFIFVVAFTVRDTGVARMTYYYCPGMTFFRHIAYVIGSAKWLAIVCSGFGLARMIDQKSFDASFSVKFNLAIAVVVFLFWVSELVYLTSTDSWQYSFHILAATSLVVIVLVGLAATLGVQLRYLALVILALELCGLVAYRNILPYPNQVLPFVRSQFADAARQSFQMQRVLRDEALQWTRFRLATGAQVYYDLSQAFLGIDLCAPFRATAITRDVDNLFRVWGMKGPDDPDDTIELPQNSFMRRVLDCNQSKLKIALNPTLATTSQEVAADIKSGNEPVILVDDNDMTFPSDKGGIQSLQGTGIDVLNFHANAIELRATNPSNRRAWLIYADSYHPAWQAFVDGVRMKTYHADIAFKALPIEPGTHQIEFVFRRGILVNPWLYLGLALTGTATCIILFALRYALSQSMSSEKLAH